MSSVIINAQKSISNEYIKTGPDEKAGLDLVFVEEPLGLPAEEGYGWPQLEFNEAIGPEKRYVVCRKLGWGMSSSTWLARDTMDTSYVAIKVLSGHCTNLVERGLVWELEALGQVSSPPSSPYCLQLNSYFTFPGKGGAGQHLCLVTKVLGGDIKALVTKHGRFPFPLAKRIILHLLRGIAHAHSRGVVHTDLKHDNIFFDTSMSSNDFDKLLTSDLPRRHPPELSYEGFVTAAVSQPLPIPTLQEAMQRTFVVADFGSARPIFTHGQEEISPLSLRPPEIMIGGTWDEKVDIWTFGCLVFELVTGGALFRYIPCPKFGLDEPNFMLYQMICYTGEDFSSELLSVSPLAGQFFDSTCNLKGNPPILDYPFDLSIKKLKVVDEADVLPIAALMRKCLRLDPAQRATAAELLSDPWFDGVD
ncbi:kinase-like protein [Armillaria gallica]|uniref:Kinase-like protein n=1 Tax=Armillaria gallica TaxID=47427 RepID=A0A2H3DV23_ARMGA|nr:kinase-like protein [Armillaria gallica]